MQDAFADHTVGLTAPVTRSEPITPNDSTDLARVTRALYVGQGGDVRLKTTAGDEVTLTGMQGGILYPVRIVRIFATGTTATGLVGLS